MAKAKTKKVPDLKQADLDLFALYHNMCPACQGVRASQAIHELEPRSKRPSDWWVSENRIPICTNCHVKQHNFGSHRHASHTREVCDNYLLMLYDWDDTKEVRKALAEIDNANKL